MNFQSKGMKLLGFIFFGDRVLRVNMFRVFNHTLFIGAHTLTAALTK